MLKKSFVALLLASSVLVASTSADAALNAYLRLKGQKSGEIKGSVTQKGRENSIMVIALDQTTSKPVGGRTNTGALVLTKEVDQSSPALHGAMANGEVFTDFQLQMWRPQLGGAIGGGGTEVQYYTVKLTNARITSIRTTMLNNKNPELMRYTEQEEVTFAYDAIEWIYVQNGSTAVEKNGG